MPNIFRRHFASLILAIIAILTINTAATAYAKAPDTQHARIELLSESDGFTPGEKQILGIHFKMDPEWHIYWRYGGETGLPPSFKWHLPDEFKRPQISWPQPEYIDINNIVNYGYHDEVLLLAELDVPQSYAQDEINIKLDLDWLICKDICLPEYGSYQITIPKASGGLSNRSDNAALFENTKQLLPKTFIGNVYFEARDFTFDVILNPEKSISSALIAAYKSNAKDIYFAPYDWGWIKLSSRPEIIIDEPSSSITLRYPRGQRAFNELDKANGLIVFGKDRGAPSYEIDGKIEKIQGEGLARFIETQQAAMQAPAEQDTASKAPPLDETQKPMAETASNPFKITLVTALLYAFLGGLILNLMPCVFPILSLKALSLMKASGKENKTALLSGVAYSAGVILSFLAIAGIMIILQMAGAEIGWGFQLQDKIVLYFLTLLMFAIGLSLIGALKLEKLLPSFIMNIGQKHVNAGGHSSSFFTGLLATIVASPCTAPFMAGALGFAATQPPYAALLIFAVLGTGLAFPYFLLSALPTSRKLLPKPGAWMETFRQFLSFPMFATAIWLAVILIKQDQGLYVVPMLVAILALAFVTWLIKHKPKSKIGRAFTLLVTLFSLFLIIGLPLRFSSLSQPLTCESDFIEGLQSSKAEPLVLDFTQARLNDYLAENNNAVFVYLTADWCITCKVNERRVLNKDRIKKVFKTNDTTIFKGDWTKMNSDITQYLNSFERNGVPLYIFYPAKNQNNEERAEPKILPQLLKFSDIELLFK